MGYENPNTIGITCPHCTICIYICILICMETKITAKSLKAEIRVRRLRQSDIAKTLQISQGHVSRLLSGDVAENSKAFKLLVKFVFKQTAQKSIEGKIIFDRLLEDCWDGTVEQANVIDEIVRSAMKLKDL